MGKPKMAISELERKENKIQGANRYKALIVEAADGRDY
jgi:hypothetical protein